MPRTGGPEQNGGCKTGIEAFFSLLESQYLGSPGSRYIAATIIIEATRWPTIQHLAHKQRPMRGMNGTCTIDTGCNGKIAQRFRKQPEKRLGLDRITSRYQGQLIRA